jgi:hypothetical protein
LQVTQLITTMEQGKILYETTVQSVFDRMRYHNVPSALQERVGMFYKARRATHCSSSSSSSGTERHPPSM